MATVLRFTGNPRATRVVLSGGSRSTTETRMAESSLEFLTVAAKYNLELLPDSFSVGRRGACKIQGTYYLGGKLIVDAE